MVDRIGLAATLVVVLVVVLEVVLVAKARVTEEPFLLVLALTHHVGRTVCTINGPLVNGTHRTILYLMQSSRDFGYEWIDKNNNNVHKQVTSLPSHRRRTPARAE